MRRQLVLAMATVLGTCGAAAGEIVARIDITEQRMTVTLDGEALFQWPVSTARPGKVTPVGTYQPQFLSRYHRSSIYNNAPMPWSIFFHGNYAIHGTDQVQYLGNPASAGCVRLHPDNARVLFEMVRDAGFENTHIVITR